VLDFLLALLIILPCMILGNFISDALLSLVKHATSEPQPEEPPFTLEFDIAERIGCLGKYQDSDVPEFIKLVDGRLFKYVGFADGTVATGEPDTLHVTIDGNLLYRLVQEPA